MLKILLRVIRIKKLLDRWRYKRLVWMRRKQVRPKLLQEANQVRKRWLLGKMQKLAQWVRRVSQAHLLWRRLSNHLHKFNKYQIPSQKHKNQPLDSFHYQVCLSHQLSSNHKLCCRLWSKINNSLILHRLHSWPSQAPNPQIYLKHLRIMTL